MAEAAIRAEVDQALDRELNLTAQVTFNGELADGVAALLESSQITRTTPLRLMILHLRHIFLTEAITFIVHLQSAALWLWERGRH